MSGRMQVHWSRDDSRLRKCRIAANKLQLPQRQCSQGGPINPFDKEGTLHEASSYRSQKGGITTRRSNCKESTLAYRFIYPRQVVTSE